MQSFEVKSNEGARRKVDVLGWNKSLGSMLTKSAIISQSANSDHLALVCQKHLNPIKNLLTKIHISNPCECNALLHPEAMACLECVSIKLVSCG